MNHFFVAGFDFGTSYSKVVLRDQLTGLAKVATFGPKDNAVFPSFVSIGKETVFGPELNQGLVTLSYPKLVAADAVSKGKDFVSLYDQQLEKMYSLLGLTSLEQVIRCVLVRYFLSVLHQIRKFIERDHDWMDFDPATDPVVVQIAVPTGLSVNDSRIDLLFQSALASATLMQKTCEAVSGASAVGDLLSACDELSSISSDELKDLNNRCITYPEVAAGVQTILRSPNIPDGKYLTLDVGAGTVDLNAFSRYSKNGTIAPKLDYWSCVVEPLGAARLGLDARTRLGADHEVAVSTLPEPELMHGLYRAVTRLMEGAFDHQPLHILGDGGSPWGRQSYAYIWGGGASHKPYEETFLRSLKESGVGIHVIDRLPKPSDHFDLPGGIDFGRLAVAFGLSFHKANLEVVRLPTMLRTFSELYPDYWQNSIDHRKLCTCHANPSCFKCNGTGFVTTTPGGSNVVNTQLTPISHYPEVHQKRVTAKNSREPKQYPSREDILIGKEFEAICQPLIGLISIMIYLNNIWELYTNSQIRLSARNLELARKVLNINVNRFKEVMTFQRGSAKLLKGACVCTVKRGYRSTSRMTILSFHAAYLHDQINQSSSPWIEVPCRIRRLQSGKFGIEVDWDGTSK
jgi:hypothetical protein